MNTCVTRNGAFALAVLVIFSAGCNKSSSGSSGNPLTAPADYVGAAVNAQKSSSAKIDLVSVNQAIQTFNAGEGRNPKDLDELVSSHYIPRLPTPPAGMKLAYDATAGKATLVADNTVKQ